MLVVGGGITGAGIARDAALRGLRVALVEKGDFASGTSHGSSQLIHGGLRYLEHLDLDLVFEALRERWILLRTAAPFVRPLSFLFPSYEEDRVSPRKLAAGVWLYDLLSWGRRIERHRRIDPSRIAELEPGLRRRGLRAVMQYSDATTDDARLTIATLRTAAAAGAACANYAEVTRFPMDGAQVTGADVRDPRTGADAQVRARFVLNATGVWAEKVLALSGRPVRRLLRPSKGSHLVFPRSRLPARHAIIFESPSDARVLFVVPWQGFTLVGTTEVDHTGEPEDARTDAAEVRYLLAAANRLFPGAGLRAGDARGTYAALRPLIEETAEATGALSREHLILEGPAGMATIVGGKLTTYRSMAEEAVNLATERLRDPAGRRFRDSTTDDTLLAGALHPDRISALARTLEADAASLSLPPAFLERLLRRYGVHARRVLALARETPEWGAPLARRIPCLGAEVVFAARHEMTLGVTDFMTRRTRLVYGARDRDLEVARRVGAILGAELGWDAATIGDEVERYREERVCRAAPLSG
ncbi:MAG: glycerol-3-phosphate dehydrogenase/oxidase [Gemmatimonadota bacterium]